MDARNGRSTGSPRGAPGRLWLHCARLQIPGERLDLRAPLTPELKQHLVALRGEPTPRP